MSAGIPLLLLYAFMKWTSAVPFTYVSFGKSACAEETVIILVSALCMAKFYY
jgi:hypothetical protein